MAVNGNEPINAGHLKTIFDRDTADGLSFVATDDEVESFKAGKTFSVSFAVGGLSITKQQCATSGSKVKISINASGNWDESAMAGVNMLNVPSEFLPAADGNVGKLNFENNGAPFTGTVSYRDGSFYGENPQVSARPNPSIKSISLSYKGDVGRFAPEGGKLITVSDVLDLINGA